MWQSSVSRKTLLQRSQLLNRIRHFFEQRQVVEVETPLLCQAPVTDIHLSALTSQVQLKQQNLTYFWQTSPEYAMKRLLAQGMGAIYQVCKAFRNHEVGRLHNVEFTMLEWYRPGFDHQQLIDEVDEFLQFAVDAEPAIKTTYQRLFEKYLSINPHTIEDEQLRKLTLSKVSVTATRLLRNDCLELLFNQFIEPNLIGAQPWIISDYPATMAALAKLTQDPHPLAERFEVYYQGIELANGYHELTDANEQYRRFQHDLQQRRQLNLPQVPIDEKLLEAMGNGLPNCAGVALGIDRLMMAAYDYASIEQVVSFTTLNA